MQTRVMYITGLKDEFCIIKPSMHCLQQNKISNMIIVWVVLDMFYSSLNRFGKN